MKNSKCLLIVLFIYGLVSCTPCMLLNCEKSDYSGRFRILDSSSNRDLLFGPNAIYNHEKIKFYSFKANDTILFESFPMKSSGNNGDSILLAIFYPKTDTAYMMLSNGDIDTLVLKFNSFDTKCCGFITEVSSFQYNTQQELSKEQYIQILKK